MVSEMQSAGKHAGKLRRWGDKDSVTAVLPVPYSQVEAMASPMVSKDLLFDRLMAVERVLYQLAIEAYVNASQQEHLVMPASEIISQVSTEDVPLCLRSYSLGRVARAFGVPTELLSQTTTEAN